MNYFGHAALAVLMGESPEFVLGAMAPDLLPMVGIRAVVAFDDAQVAQGASFHLRTDALFHETETFMDLNREALAGLRQLGISRGPARASAHMGVEMLIDATLIQDERFKQGYLEALAAAATAPSLFAPLPPP